MINKEALDVSIPWAKPYLGSRAQRLVSDAVRSSWISGGAYVDQFESQFGAKHEGSLCCTTSSGTAALMLALLGLGIGRGDEVIVSGFTFVAPINMIIATGARPIYADINPQTWCVDVASVKQLISVKTKAILVVHPYGNIVDMPAIKGLCARHQLFLIEDVAQAALSRYQGRLAGTFGDIACFSFQSTKTIAMGEGGCVITRNKKYHARMRMLRDHGMSPRRRYWHDELGYNFRLTNMQAALGVAQLTDLEKIVLAKQKVYASYRQCLGVTEGISFQLFKPEVVPVVWCVAIKVDSLVFGKSRDTLMKRLLKCGIETRPGFYPVSVMPLYHARPLPITEQIAAHIICLPSFPTLKQSQIKYICAQLIALRGKR